MKNNNTEAFLIEEGLKEFFAPQEEPTPLEVLLEAIDYLKDCGITVNLNEYDYSQAAIMVAEAVNLAAKVIDYSFYDIKPSIIEAAVALGAKGGWGDDNYFYLADRTVGVVSFYDRYCEIGCSGRWEHPWSRISRQNMAFMMLQDPQILRLYAEATHPEGALAGIRPATVYRINNRVLSSRHPTIDYTPQ